MMISTVNLISGSGSTNLAALEAQRPGGILHGLVETAAIICNNSKAKGPILAEELGFSRERIHYVSRAKGDLGEQIIEVLEKYNPDYYHQLGWLPWMPDSVISRFRGLNQHLGPGGQFMIGPRRILAHLLFCAAIEEQRPIPVFCQLVHPVYDQGDAIFARYAGYSFKESVDAIAKRLLPIEHAVQIEALRLLATGQAKPFPVPRVYKDWMRESGLMDQSIKQAHEFYLAKEKAGDESEVFLMPELYMSPCLV